MGPCCCERLRNDLLNQKKRYLKSASQLASSLGDSQMVVLLLLAGVFLAIESRTLIQPPALTASGLEPGGGDVRYSPASGAWLCREGLRVLDLRTPT